MTATAAWLQSRQQMWHHRQKFLRYYALTKLDSIGDETCQYSIDEFVELVGADEGFTELLTEFKKALDDVAGLIWEIEFADKPQSVFVSPAVIIRRTVPRQVGRSTKSGTGNKDPSDPDGDGDGDDEMEIKKTRAVAGAGNPAAQNSRRKRW